VAHPCAVRSGACKLKSKSLKKISLIGYERQIKLCTSAFFMEPEKDFMIGYERQIKL
jgi:hypothetical protein